MDFLIIYILFSSIGCGIGWSLKDEVLFSSNKSLVYFVFGFIFGSVIVPIKFVKGVIELIKEQTNEKRR